MNKFVDNNEYKTEVMIMLNKKVKINSVMYNVLKIATLIAALAGIIIIALIMGKVFYGSYPGWFFFATASISSAIALMGSLINFFVLKDSIAKYKKERQLVELEILKYENKVSKRYKSKDRDFNLDISIGVIIGSKAAKKELSNV